MSITINISDFPILATIKEDALEKLCTNIFQTGYDIHFPNKDILLKSQESNIINNSLKELNKKIDESGFTEIGANLIIKINEKIEPLNNSLSKLLGLQTASCKKGELGENIIQNAFITRYGDIVYDDKSHVPHSGDAWITLSNGKIIMIESKNYTNTVNTNEITKMENDMKSNNIRYSLFLSLNAQVQGFRDMDLHTFVHNNETYFAIIVSNLTNNISKLDLAFNMMKKIIDLFNSSLIQKKINDGMTKINNITAKNYLLRDSFYILEKSIYTSLDSYYKILRDYQYELEELIKSLIEEISTCTINESLLDIFASYKDKKIYSIILILVDLVDKKKWDIKLNNKNKYNIIEENIIIGIFEVQLKKIIFNIKDTIIEFKLNSSKQNKININLLNNI